MLSLRNWHDSSGSWLPQGNVSRRQKQTLTAYGLSCDSSRGYRDDFLIVISYQVVLVDRFYFGRKNKE